MNYLWQSLYQLPYSLYKLRRTFNYQNGPAAEIESLKRQFNSHPRIIIKLLTSIRTIKFINKNNERVQKLSLNVNHSLQQ
jgi:hypothetical protein